MSSPQSVQRGPRKQRTTRLASDLRQRIEQGDLKVGTWVPPVRELAEQYEVSRNTVQAALRRLEDEGLVTYQPRRGGVVKAQGHRPSLKHVITVLLNRNMPQGYFQSEILEGGLYPSIEQELGQRGFQLHFSFYDVERKYEVFDSLIRSGSGDGMVMAWGQGDQAVADLLRRHHFPHVTNDYQAERFGINTVTTHASDGVRQAVEHLVDLGHRSIGILSPRHLYRFGITLAALANAGLPLDESLHCTYEPTAQFGKAALREGARQAMEHWLDRGPTATAMICHNDDVARGAVDAMSQRGLEPGRDLSLIGYDNIERRGPTPSNQPLLTTVDNPLDQTGQRMTELLLNQILHGQMRIVHERIPAPLIVRESTGPVGNNQGSISMHSEQCLYASTCIHDG